MTFVTNDEPEPGTLERNAPSAIGDYGIIGDCKSAALISKSGSMDWLCWPHFSSNPVLSLLIDENNGGVWSIRPIGSYVSSRRYIGKTNVLETTFETKGGTVVLTDFMPVTDDSYQGEHLEPERQIRRILRCDRGAVDMRGFLRIASGFDSKCPPIANKGKLGLRVELPQGMVALYSDLDWVLNDSEAYTAFALGAGDERTLTLTYSTEGPAVMPAGEGASRELQRTLDWWETWSSKFSYTGPHADEVQRSILTLKLLQFAPTGAFVAAVTTSLPENEGRSLNWDYRYCWLRDASFNLQALCSTGYGEEAMAFMEWMLHATRLTQPKLMTCYDLFGNPVPGEIEFPKLSGFKGSRPVRAGNLAGKQHQLDVYGEVICGAAQVIRGSGSVDKETQQVLMKFGQFVVEHWIEPDAGIWESRDKPIIHTHSQLLCWVALEELVRLHEDGFLCAPLPESFRRVRGEIRISIETASWNERLPGYASAPGGSEIDATLLLFALHNFEKASSERMQETYRQVVASLAVGDGPLLRNKPKPGSASEGTFGICGFWAAEFLAMGGGSLADAEHQFEQMLRCANDLGLYSEENDCRTLAPLGNFPQTFTHVGLINAALALEKRADPSTGGAQCTA